MPAMSHSRSVKAGWLEQHQPVLLVSVALAAATIANTGCAGQDDVDQDNVATAVARAVLSETEKITPNDGVADDGFGVSVAVSAATLAVGARAARNDAAAQGAVYVFERDGNTLVQSGRLRPADLVGGELFGLQVALWEDLLVATAPWTEAAGPEAGAAYVFERVGGAWQQQAKLAPAEVDGWDRFGWQAALVGDTLVVGASVYGDDSAGAAYVFERSGDTWTQAQQFAASDPGASRQFGTSLAFDGNTIAVACYRHPVVYVFERNASGQWTEQQQLRLPELGVEATVGFYVAVDGDWLAVGVPSEPTEVANANGKAYLFQRASGSWTFTQALSPSNRESVNEFGEAVRLAGDTLLANSPAPYSSDLTPVFVFRRQDQTWVETDQLIGSDIAVEDGFGLGLAIGEQSFFVGSPYKSEAAEHSGAVYVFERDLGASVGAAGGSSTGSASSSPGGASDAAAATDSPASDEAGCGCRVASSRRTGRGLPAPGAALALVLLCLLGRRRAGQRLLA
jgi:hypothetical protein